MPQPLRLRPWNARTCGGPTGRRHRGRRRRAHVERAGDHGPPIRGMGHAWRFVNGVTSTVAASYVFSLGDRRVVVAGGW